MIELKNVRFSVPADESQNGGGPERTIIDDVSFTFEEGKFYGITGPNGGGKTTLSKLIMGIHPITSGSISLDGRDISNLSITDRARAGIAYGFQNSARFKGTTFRDLLSIAAGTDDEATLTRIISGLGICSLDFLEKPVDTKLSGGEIKKIELATIIARNPKVAIYDEPDTGIDLWTIRPMVDVLKREQAEKGTTTIVVSHNRTFLEAADVIIMIRDGRIAYTGGLNGALPILEDLSACSFGDLCEGETDVRCFR
jgi:Fe-S cluster assembly ATP-binding protein